MKAVALILAAVFAACGAEQDLRCIWGSSYWCSGLDVAKSCGAYNHCKTTVWKNKLLSKDDSDYCLYCKTLFDDVKIFIKHDKPQNEISHFLSSACSLLPGSSADKCKKISESMITEIIDLINSGVDDQIMCGLLGGCTGLEDTVLHYPVSPPSHNNMAPSSDKKLEAMSGVANTQICDDCKKFFTDIQQMIAANATEQEIENLINEQVCAQLGSLEQECKSLVHEFLPEILKMLSQYYDPDLICKSLGVCSTEMKEMRYHLMLTRLHNTQLYKAASSQNSATGCLMCKSVMSQLQIFGRDKPTQDMIIHVLKTQLCAHLGSVEGLCVIVMDQYSAEIFEMLIQFLEPDMRCRSLGFCEAAGNSVQPALPLAAAKRPNTETTFTDPSPTCVMCEFAVKEVEAYLKQNATEEQIIKAMEKMCDYMPESEKKPCKDFVDTYGRQVIEMLVQGLDPLVVCTKIGLCSQTNALPQADSVQPALKLVPAKRPNTDITSDPSAPCVMCEFVVREIKTLIGKNATEEEIMAALEKVCSYMPDTVKKTCTDFVDTYGPLVVEMLIHELDPNVVCVEIGLCKDNKQMKAGSIRPALPLTAAKQSSVETTVADPSPQCVMCEFIMKEVKTFIGQNATEEEIMQALEKVCSYMPDTLKKSCKDFVDTYGPVVIEMLVHDLDPAVVCTQIGLCKDSKTGHSKPDNKLPVPKVGNSETCTVCVALVQYLEALLDQGSSMEQIEAMMEKLCGYLPSSMVSECDSLVKKYGDLIIHYISTLAPPQQVCRLAGICDDKGEIVKDGDGLEHLIRVTRSSADESEEVKVKAPVLGKDPCTWGPMYWCSSHQAATDCEKLSYCENVWQQEGYP